MISAKFPYRYLRFGVLMFILSKNLYEYHIFPQYNRAHPIKEPVTSFRKLVKLISGLSEEGKCKLFESVFVILDYGI